jgi:glycosyltransferase involved in cell wall biosynthesis
MATISAMIICRDEAQRIGDCLDATAFCDERVVVDSGSTDGTLDILRSRDVRLFERPFVSWNDQKDFGRAQCAGDWVLNVDADEVVTPELRDEIRGWLDRGVPEGVDGFRMPFRNHFRGAWVRSCGYYPDRHVRLVRRVRARWDVEAVHDRLVVEGRVDELAGHIDHHSFESIADFLHKSGRYAEAFARHAHARGRRAGVADLLLRPAFRFFRAAVLQGGLAEGALGVTIAGLQACEVFQRYARLWELGRFGPPRGSDGA